MVQKGIQDMRDKWEVVGGKKVKGGRKNDHKGVTGLGREKGGWWWLRQ